MKVKVAEASGPVLDWMVAKCENADWSDEDCIVNVTTLDEYTGTMCNYSTDWEQGGPIIEEHGIHLEWSESHEHWLAYSWDRFSNPNHHMADGDTALIAAMRCHCLSKLGEEVEVPDDLN